MRFSRDVAESLADEYFRRMTLRTRRMLRIRISAHNAAMLPMIPLVKRVSCFELEGELELGSELEIVLEIVVAKVVLEINVDVLWVRRKRWARSTI